MIGQINHSGPQPPGRDKLRFGVGLLCALALGWLTAMGCASHRPEPDFQLMSEA